MSYGGKNGISQPKTVKAKTVEKIDITFCFYIYQKWKKKIEYCREKIRL